MNQDENSKFTDSNYLAESCRSKILALNAIYEYIKALNVM